MTTQTNTSFTAKATRIAFAAFATFVVLMSVVPSSAEAGPRYPFGLGSLSGTDLGSGR
jgi:hypothetical protein